MRNHHIKKNSKEFFEGWYFKHQAKGHTIAFIPGIHIPKRGKAFVFVQIITNNKSYFVKYPYKAFYADKKKLHVKIGNNKFSKEGIVIDINTPKLKIKGIACYGKLTPIEYDIMGPFSIIPNMECNHGVISLHHSILGYFKINDFLIDLNNGIGYIEKDWGSSFPKSYTWLQCNDFRDKTSIMISIAHIPFYGLTFQGLIAIVYYKGKEYRFATYNGGKVIYASDREILIKKGPYALKATIARGKGFPLQAPYLGDMSRTIHERPSCLVKFTLYNKGHKIFQKQSRHASFEYVEKT